jgi:hypothetical protein
MDEMHLKLHCNIDLHIIDAVNDPYGGMTLSFDPETEVITLSGTYTGPREHVAENVSNILTRALVSFAQHKDNAGKDAA